jgi:hypothetical protein
MNCSAFREQMVELLDIAPDAPNRAELLRHAQDCPECHRELEEARALLADLAPSSTVHASNSFKERVMQKVLDMEAGRRPAPARPAALWRRSWTFRTAAAAALLLVVVGSYNWLAGRGGAPQVTAFTVLAQAAEVMSRIKTMHLVCKMRTRDHDNFESINLNGEMIALEIWKQFDSPAKWRIQKQRRVTVNDGQSVLLMVWGGDDSGQPSMALTAKAESAESAAGWLAPLLDMNGLLTREIDQAHRDQATVLLEHETGSDGRPKTIVTIQAEAKGDFTQSDYARNKSVDQSDNTRQYYIDDQTNRLEAMQVFVNAEGREVLVFELVEAAYDEALEPDLFSTQPPQGVATQDARQMMTQSGVPAQNARDAAQQFFTALGRNDWDTVNRMHPFMTPILKRYPGWGEQLKGLEIVSLGEPFKSGQFPGWFVPYEIRYRNGEIKKMNLAVRNDKNPQGLWQVDGGF